MLSNTHDTCRWKACGTQQRLPVDWAEALGCPQLRAFQQRRLAAHQLRRLRRMRDGGAEEAAAAAAADAAAEADGGAEAAVADSEPQADADAFGCVAGLTAAGDASEESGECLPPYGQDDGDFGYSSGFEVIGLF